MSACRTTPVFTATYIRLDERGLSPERDREFALDSLLVLLRAIAAALLFTTLVASTARAQQPDANATAELSGRITFLPPSGQKAGPGGTLIWLPGVAAEAPATAAPSITSSNKRFEPHVLVVRRGTQVAFPNVDTIYHNAFSLSPGNTFDLGLYRKGASRSATLKSAGLVRVYCNIHPEMAAFVMVVEGSAYAIVGDDGAYRVRGIPPGRHVVQLWNEMAGEKSITLDFAAGKPAEWSLTLDGSQYRRASHKNKFGKDYPPATKDADRY